MRDAKPSTSAQFTALTRAHLTQIGVLDDGVAESMLWRRWHATGRALYWWPLIGLTRSPTFSYVATRTRFFDNAVAGALDEGIEQVVVIGAGYDSRSWRFARAGVVFFEVDHRATQLDKQQRAPTGGPRCVPADLTVESLTELLPAAGFRVGERALFTLEGLTMYLSERDVTTMLSTIAELAGPGSRLAVDFAASGGGSVAPISRIVAAAIRASWARGGEHSQHWVTPADVPALLARTGWTLQEALSGPEAADRYLTGTHLPTSGINPQVMVVTATRR